MMHLIWSVIIGFIVGMIANWIPGVEHIAGFWMKALIGIAGSLAGGFIGGLIKKPADGAMFHPAGFFMSIAGAVLILFLLKVLGIQL
jgi:uncharacterized membrane protein YeaQ/YmgE (transglycosylase-associated protein family)